MPLWQCKNCSYLKASLPISFSSLPLWVRFLLNGFKDKLGQKALIHYMIIACPINRFVLWSPFQNFGRILNIWNLSKMIWLDLSSPSNLPKSQLSKLLSTPQKIKIDYYCLHWLSGMGASLIDNLTCFLTSERIAQDQHYQII